MADPQKALETQLAHIEERLGKSLAELRALLAASGHTAHGALRDFAKDRFGLGHGDANTLAHHYLGYGVAPDADPLATLYAGPKAALRPIHEALVAAMAGWGEYETVPKKGYFSLRRKKQFAMVGPATNTRVEVGLNVRGLASDERLMEQPAGGMCTYKVRLASADEVDAPLIAWLREAWESAG